MHDAVESAWHGGKDSRHRGFVGHVCREEREPLSEVGRWGPVGADDGATLGDQALSRSQTDPRCDAGHNERAGMGAITHFGHSVAFPCRADGYGSVSVMAITLAADRRCSSVK